MFCTKSTGVFTLEFVTMTIYGYQWAKCTFLKNIPMFESLKSPILLMVFIELTLHNELLNLHNLHDVTHGYNNYNKSRCLYMSGQPEPLRIQPHTTFQLYNYSTIIKNIDRSLCWINLTGLMANKNVQIEYLILWNA